MASLMRRLAPAAALTGSAVAIVALFDPGIASLGGGSASAASSVPDAVASMPAPAPTSGAGSAAGSGDTSGSGTGSGSTSDSGAGSGSGSTAAASCDTAQEVTGPVVQTRWGPVQVAAKVVDGNICEARAVVSPDGDRKSVMINQQALPIINAEVVEQGVAFDAVSGATVTSEGYRQSLQALLDSL